MRTLRQIFVGLLVIVSASSAGLAGLVLTVAISPGAALLVGLIYLALLIELKDRRWLMFLPNLALCGLGLALLVWLMVAPGGQAIAHHILSHLHLWGQP